MEIYGSFYCQLDTVEGDSKNGHWVRGGFVITTGDEIDRYVAFTFKKEELFPLVASLKKGQRIKVRFVPESQEHEGRWYVDCKCLGIKC